MLEGIKGDKVGVVCWTEYHVAYEYATRRFHATYELNRKVVDIIHITGV